MSARFCTRSLVNVKTAPVNYCRLGGLAWKRHNMELKGEQALNIWGKGE